jgi:thiol-disulfide isomerase/thioredoxin
MDCSYPLIPRLLTVRAVSVVPPLSFAPWCPACQQLQPAWSEFADWGEDMGVNIAKVDVTEQPGKHCFPPTPPEPRVKKYLSPAPIHVNLSVCVSTFPNDSPLLSSPVRFEWAVHHNITSYNLPVSGYLGWFISSLRL